MAIEVVIFHVQPTVTRADFLAAVAETTALLKTQDGFISLMATLMLQLRGAQLPQNSKIAQDFWTLIYQAITD